MLSWASRVMESRWAGITVAGRSPGILQGRKPSGAGRMGTSAVSPTVTAFSAGTVNWTQAVLPEMNLLKSSGKRRPLPISAVLLREISTMYMKGRMTTKAAMVRTVRDVAVWPNVRRWRLPA